MNRLSSVCASILDINFVSKIGGANQFDAIGKRIYNNVMNDPWEKIFSSGYMFGSRISGGVEALLSDKDYSHGEYFWNANYQYFGGNNSNNKCISPIGSNWQAYKDQVFVITQSIGGTSFFKYSNPNQHWHP
jgi:hypothetical protein